MSFRLLQVCCEMPPLNGGIGTAVADLAPALARLGFHLDIIGLYPPATLRHHALPTLSHMEDQTAPGSVTIHRRGSPWTALPHPWRVRLERRTLRRLLASLARRTRPQALLADDYEGWVPRPPLPSLPLITRLNGSNRVYDALLNRAGDPSLHAAETAQLAASNAWIGVSRFFLERTRACTGLPGPSHSAVIPNAIDATQFAPASYSDRNIIPGRIMLHNTLGPRKGVQDLLVAFARLIQSRPDATLVLCGSPSNPAWLEEQLAQLPPTARAAVTVAGRLDRHGALQAQLRQAAVACYPSHLETFGIAPVEAMAMGKVTVYADCGPAREVITPGHDGFLCPVAQPEALATVLLEALALPAEQRHRLGENARATVLQRFDRPVVAAQMAEFLCGAFSGSFQTRQGL